MSTDQHYSQNLSVPEVESILSNAYPDGANSFQLAPLDQLHIGGVKASEKLVSRVKSLKTRRILDIGSGPGGLGRLVTQSCYADYVGLDITHDLNRLNRMLSQHHENTPDIPVLTGDAQSLPFEDRSFDLIIMQHTLLNIPDKQQAIEECRRVLSANGKLLLHEVVCGVHPDQMLFPVPWASQSGMSHLITREDFIDLFQKNKASNIQLEDWTEEALSWRKRQTTKETQPVSQSKDKSSAPLFSPAAILGPEFKTMGANVQKNLSSGAIGIVEVMISF